jgi:hypothetical protein
MLLASRRAPFALAWASVVALAGCGLADPFDGGTDAGAVDAPTTPRRVLEADGPTTVTVAPGAEVTLRVRVRDGTTGRAAAGIPLTYALEGAPRGSTLRMLEGESDDEGRGSVILAAGPVATTFRVRVLAMGAAPLGFDVSVGTEFGELVVNVGPPAHRAVSSYVVRAAADLPCAEVQAAPGGVERTLGTELASTSFAALSTAAAWTVDVRALNGAGLVVARGCVEGVRVSAGGPTELTVPARDVPLDATGGYLVSLGVIAPAVGSEARETVLASVPDAEGTSAALLDALAEELRASGDVTPLIAARAAGLDARLRSELEGRGDGWRSELEGLAADADARFATLTLEGTLLQRAGVALSLSRATLGDATRLGPFEATVGGSARVPEEDAQTLTGLALTLPPGTLWVAALRGSGDLAARTREGASCTAMVEVVAGELSLDRCDEDCVRAACARASATLETALDTGARAADAVRPALRFDATLSLEDTDQDLRADVLASDTLPARWEALDGSARLDASVTVSGLRDAALE